MVPPLSLDLEGEKKRKRLTSDTLKGYWDIERGDRAFPSMKNVRPEAISEIWANCFIVEASNNSRKEDYKYLYLGEKIIEAYGQDLTGMKVDALVCPQVEHLETEYERVLAFKRPVEDEGELDVGGRHIKYRQILLPLGDDGVNINAILGGFSYKVDE